MKFDALHSLQAKLSAGLLAAASVILASCGGGGAAGTGEGGNVRVLPNPGTFYAGVPSVITVTGGRQPYYLGSSDPTILPLPAVTNSTFIDVIPMNPGVVDTGLTEGEVPRRTVTVTARDTNGNVNSSLIAVLQNFLTGYGISIVSDCPANAAGDIPQACAGGESIVRAFANSNGGLYGNRQFRYETLRGPFQWVVAEDPSNNTPVLANSYTTVTDHAGAAIGRLRVTPGVPPQLATFRVIDVATGVYAEHVIIISAGPPAGTITLLPNTLTFQGRLTTECGGGSGDVLIQGGEPPYTLLASGGVFTSPTTTVSTSPYRFNVTVPAGVPPCPAAGAVTVTDSRGRTGSVTAASTAGTGTLPALQVSPATVDLNNTCGFQASVSVVGGTGSYSTSSTHPRVTAGAGGTTLTIARIGTGDTAAPYPATGTVGVTDGTTIATVTVNNVATTCP